MSGRERQAAQGEDEVAGVADDVGSSLERTVSALVRWSTRSGVRRSMMSRGSDLSATDTWLLGRLDQVDRARMGDLAQWQAVDRSTITSQVRRLESRDLVTREPDPADRRSMFVALTAEGRHAVRENRAAAARVLRDLIAPWTPQERDELVRALGRLAAAVEDAAISGAEVGRGGESAGTEWSAEKR